MGVRGLTTFIGANAEVYLKPHELHDTNLVIDGDNLCLQLFKKSQLSSAPLAGNYDLYHWIVVDFFKMLSMCKVVPYVLLDGGYEPRKMATAKKRMVEGLHQIGPFNIFTRNVRPLMLREVFVDALRAAGVSVMRCAFEADDEVAILARKLNCPVLSYDSDFYIHNVQYIPYVTITHKVYRKVTDKAGDNFQIGIVEWNRSKPATQKSQRIKFVAQYGDEAVVNSDAAETYCYLDCCIYTIDRLIGPEERLEKEMLPLFAVLLGNDYIESKVLASFYHTISSGRVNRKIHRQQRRIKVVLKWLQRHTLHSAIRTIVKQVRGKTNQHIHRQILTAMRGYNCEDCTSYGYFGFREKGPDDALGNEDMEKNIYDCLRTVGANDENEEENDVAAADEENRNEFERVKNDAAEISREDNATEMDAHSCDNPVNLDDLTSSSQSDASEEDPIEYTEEHKIQIRNGCTDNSWPEWFRELYRGAKVPRFSADLFHSNFYMNYPQLEDIGRSDSNAISYPILRMHFALLKSCSKRASTEFKYVTRKEVGHSKNINTVLFEDVILPEGVSFDPTNSKNFTIMQHLFEESKIGDWGGLLKSIRNLPTNLQLYFLAIIFWAKNSQSANLAHVQALIVCLLQLQIVDPTIKSKNRDVALFHKQHKAYLDDQRKVVKTGDASAAKDDDQPKGFNRAFFNQLTSATSRPELMLVYEALIANFALNVKLKHNVCAVRSAVHTFAELQSVCYNFYALVPLLGYPFENVRMHELFNSMFVYNVFHRVRFRDDPCEYICTTIFRYSPILQTAFRRMAKFVEQYVPELQDRLRQMMVKDTKVKRNNPANKKPSKAQTGTTTPSNDCSKQDDESENDESGFFDINNKFSQLLLTS